MPTIRLKTSFKGFFKLQQHEQETISRICCQPLHTGRQCKSYNTDGFYISARGIIINPADYKYNYACSGVDNPADKNLELMLGFGYLNLKDAKALADAPIAGMAKAGRMSDLSAGLSFFWNKYVTLRLNYHYIHSHTGDQPSAKVVNVVQMRVQYMF